MKIYLFILCILTGCDLFAQSFYTFHNEELIEKRSYKNEKLQSIICYEQQTPKDSLIYDGNDVQCFQLQGDSIIKELLCPYTKYYYCEFDESLQNNYIYQLVKSKKLLERILYFLATIDSEVTNDGASVEKRSTIVSNTDDYCVQYKNINMKFLFFAELETYRYEALESMYLNISNGILTHILLNGKNTDISIIFVYQNQVLKKEKIYYYKNKSHRYTFYEEYSYEKNEVLQKD